MRIAASLLLFHLLVPSLTRGDEPREQVVILCYHEVEETASSRYTVSRKDFREQLDLIEKLGYSVVSLRDAVDYLKEERASIAPKPVVLTIDDGWLCTRTEMFEELEKRKLPYTVFVYPNIVSSGEHALTWSMVKEISAGRGSVESHALSHPFLTHGRNAAIPQAQYNSWLANELNESKRLIERKIEKEVRFLAYPFGDHNDAVTAATAAAGYEAAVTTNRGPNRPGDDPYRLKRYLFHGDTTLVDLERWLRGGPM